MKILFVCRGNVGRSQIAELIFNRRSDTRHFASSAGTNVREKEGQSLEELGMGAQNVVETLKEVNINAANQKRTQLTEALMDEADMVITMAEKDRSPDYLLNNPEAIYWEVPDPKHQPAEVTREIRNTISDLVEKLINDLNQK